MKKWILMILVATCAVFCALGLAACVPQGIGEHVWSGWKYDVSSEQGLARGHWRACEECGLRKDEGPHEFLPVEGHIEDEPTCGEPGWGWLQCSTCRLIIVGEIPVTGDHDYQELSRNDATCGVDGLLTLKCSVCNDITTEPLPATGEHDYEGGQTSSDESGHKLRCVVCSQWSAVLPHSYGEEPTKTTAPVGTNDGSAEYTCGDCKYVDVRDIRNPNVPVALDVKLSFNGSQLPMVDYGNGKKVTMTAAGVGDVYIYDVLFTATYPDGHTETNIEALTLEESGDGGVRAYRQLPSLIDEEWIIGSSEYFTYGMGDGIKPVFRVIYPGNYTAIFRYETGYWGSDEHRVRAEFYLYIESVAAPAAASVNLSVVDDGLTCLATGAYGSKEY